MGLGGLGGLLLLVWVSISGLVRSECENACSGHGRCTAYDMCICDRNWQSSDCGDRTCMFGLSFVDTPKGDLDSSGEHDPPEEQVVVNDAVYPYGTSELFPSMVDSDHNVQSNSAHDYAECSNAGICNRRTGVCECFDLFEGVACQRMKCPGTPVCSGHGVCQSARQIARNDYTLYRLWSKDLLRGCVCDPGFYGGDCSMRRCKIGVDPLYFDDNSAIQYPFFFFAIMTTASTYDLSNGHPQPGQGYFSIKVFDQDGDDYFTTPIAAPATCEDLLNALESLPRQIIPAGKTACLHRSVEGDAYNSSLFSITYEGLYRSYLSGTRYNTIENAPADINAGYVSSYFNSHPDDPQLVGDLYLLQFYGNAYDFGQPDISVHLGDGERASLLSPGGVLVTKAWTNGQQGLGVDYFNYRCNAGGVRLAHFEGNTFLAGPFLPEIFLQCLGENDDIAENNVEHVQGVYDYGTMYTPHVIRLVRAHQESNEGGQLAVVYWDTTITNFDTQSGGRSLTVKEGAFRLLHPLRALDDSPFSTYDLYVSNARVQAIQNESQAVFNFGSNHIYTVNTTAVGPRTVGDAYDGDVSCDAWRRRQQDGWTAHHDPYDTNNYCLERGDLFFLLDPYNTSNNAPFVNLYRARALRSVNPEESQELEDLIYNDVGVTSRLWRKNLIVTDYHTNWAQSYDTPGRFHVYRFTPNARRTYQYAAECSNRGVCNAFEGLCECFNGYAGDGCQTQESIAS